MRQHSQIRIKALGDLTIHRRILDYLDRNMIGWSGQNDVAMFVNVDRLPDEDKAALIELGAEIELVQTGSGPNNTPSRFY